MIHNGPYKNCTTTRAFTKPIPVVHNSSTAPSMGGTLTLHQLRCLCHIQTIITTKQTQPNSHKLAPIRQFKQTYRVLPASRSALRNGSVRQFRRRRSASQRTSTHRGRSAQRRSTHRSGGFLSQPCRASAVAAVAAHSGGRFIWRLEKAEYRHDR